MTEAEWLAATDPGPMLAFMRGKASDRKVRLFVVACARAVWDQLLIEDTRSAVEIGERVADGLASDAERKQIMQRLYAMPLNASQGHEEFATFFATRTRTQNAAYLAALVAVRPCRSDREITTGPSWDESTFATRPHQPNLLRELFGPLLFRPATLDPAWRTSTVTALASQMYGSREFGAMPILADALQDAGCDSEDVLAHCRGPGPHVRGCWVVDLVLGKS